MSRNLTTFGVIVYYVGMALLATTIAIIVYIMGMKAGLDSARRIICDSPQGTYENPALCEGREW